MFHPSRELSDLLAALCDQRLEEGDRARLEELLLADREALRFYLEYIQLHGMLHWDAVAGTVARPQVEPERRAAPRVAPSSRGWRWFSLGAAALAAAVLLLIGGWRGRTAPPDAGVEVAQRTPGVAAPDAPRTEATADVPASGARGPLRLSPAPAATADAAAQPAAESGEIPPLPPPDSALADAAAHRSSEALVDTINQALRAYWAEHEVTPSPPADDAEWLRRVHLDLIGQIPSVDAVLTFLADQRPDKRARVVDDLLASPDFARHFSVVWSNLLIGHASPREVNRPAFEKFLREQFHRNRPWSETVARLISAEGFEDEDGATNFLLAHLNNEAVPATAVTARVLLCEQVQCTQCHHHPTSEWRQERFWELNAFFQQTEIVRHRRGEGTGLMRDRLELVSLETGGPTYFEDRQARVSVAYPRFAGVDVDPSEQTNRRRELARLLCAGEEPQVARAFINRTWAKLFGCGFTTPVDDMGPHNPPVLPDLLDELTRRFVRAGYDVKLLLRWLCLSEAYGLSSRPAAGNAADRPELGHPPLFSRMYVKPLTAEQLFDSLLVATQADRAGARYWDEVEARRRQWLEQFYTALDNDENAEEDGFQGSLAQTLVMMNGDLIRQATTPAPGTVLQQILARPVSDEEKIRLLSLAALSRYPTAEELSSLRRLIRQQVQARSRDVPAPVALQESLRDLLWAYLNSTEFRSNH